MFVEALSHENKSNGAQPSSGLSHADLAAAAMARGLTLQSSAPDTRTALRKFLEGDR